MLIFTFSSSSFEGVVVPVTGLEVGAVGLAPEKVPYLLVLPATAVTGERPADGGTSELWRRPVVASGSGASRESPV
jgi:hypothetical protein